MARRGGTSAAGNVQGVTGLVLVPDACAFTWGALQIHRSPATPFQPGGLQGSHTGQPGDGQAARTSVSDCKSLF